MPNSQLSTSVSLVLFLSILLVILVCVILYMNLEKKRRRVRQLAFRLEHITKNEVKHRIHTIRILSWGVFFIDQLIDDLEWEIKDLESNNNISPPTAKIFSSIFSTKRLNLLESRIIHLEETVG